MQLLSLHNISRAKQIALSLLTVILVGAICYVFSALIAYHVVAFILLVTVSLLAMLFDILPVLLAAAMSALIWDFFFIPPHFTFQVSNTEDAILLLMYFIIAMVNAALSYKLHRIEKESMEKEERARTIQLYNSFLNSLSHELRTPTTVIIGAIDNLQHSGGHLTPQNRVELIGEISTAALRLNRQVDNLLNMSRLESGFILAKPDWCDIGEVVHDAVQKAENSGAKQKISISINPALPLLKLDKWMLEQIVGNLLDNAVLYTSAHDRITISANAYADMLELVIEDTGKGFPKEEIAHVFGKFYRLKASGAGGIGLGLSIVKGFTEALGGSIAVQNTPLGGARFIIQVRAETSHRKPEV